MAIGFLFFTISMAQEESSGIPWNRDYFDTGILLRQTSIDPALFSAYSYTVSFASGPFGSFAQSTYMAHLAYEFSPDVHLFANLGLWMPLYTSIKTGAPVAKEDARQGNMDFILPDITLEYKINQNATLHLSVINEEDYMKAYVPHFRTIIPRRNSNFWP